MNEAQTKSGGGRSARTKVRNERGVQATRRFKTQLTGKEEDGEGKERRREKRRIRMDKIGKGGEKRRLRRTTTVGIGDFHMKNGVGRKRPLRWAFSASF